MPDNSAKLERIAVDPEAAALVEYLIAEVLKSLHRRQVEVSGVFVIAIDGEGKAMSGFRCFDDHIMAMLPSTLDALAGELRKRSVN